jgi:rhodanese-related sulfurtransferase
MGLFDLFGNKKKKIQDFLQRGAVILDVRTHAEYKNGALPGSKHIPLQQVSAQLSEIKKWNKPVITCCQRGARSGQAATYLINEGVEVINGGGWVSMGKNI